MNESEWENRIMPNVTIALGVLLILLGVGGYVASGGASWTALIPALFGVPMVLLGILAGQERWRRHAMHAAAALALLGVLGTARGLIGLVTLVAGGEVARPAATVSQAIMAILCVVFLALCVRSFVSARRKSVA